MKQTRTTNPFLSGTTALVFPALAALTFVSSAALTVSTSPVLEGTAGGPPGEAVFTLTLSPPAAADATFEYTTSSDTARELEDYQPARGRVVIPAGQTSATVRVALTPDSWQEGPESFSLIVWPAGSYPAPVLSTINPPGGNSADFTGQLAGLSEGNWFVGNLLGERVGTSWNGLRYFSPVNPLQPFSEVSLALSGRWLGSSYSTFPSVESPSGYAAVGFSDKLSNPPGSPAWNSQIDMATSGKRKIVMSGDIAVIEVSKGVKLMEFYQLHPGAPARFLGSFVLPPVALADNPFPGSSEVIVSAISLAGRRLAVATPSVIRIFEASGPDRTSWSQIAYLPQLTEPMALEGDTLLATPSAGAEAGIPCIYRKNQGGAGAWGRTAVLAVPGGNFPVSPYSTTFRGGMVLIGDQLGGSSTTPSNPGRIHRFVPDIGGASWSYASFFRSPTPQTTDYFGMITAQAGLDVLSSASFIDGLPGFAGSFPGATVRIDDDDAPVVRLETTAVDEPAANGATVRVEARLSQRSPVDVTVQWTTDGGTATPGLDYVAAGGNLTIPAGQDSAVFNISVLPDNEVEPTEFFSVRIISASGAAIDSAPVSIGIRDTTRVSIVYAPGRNLFEDLPSPPAQVQCFPFSKPLTFGWSIGGIGFSQGAAGPEPDSLAQPGLDWPATSGTLTAASAGTVMFPWSVTSDALVEKTEAGNVSFDLPAGAVSASFSLRHFYQLPEGSGYQIERISTDGNTIAALESSPQFGPYSLMLFLRSGSVPGGWERRVIPPPAGLDQWPSAVVKVSGGRLVVYAFSTGECWFFAENLGGPRNWGLEAHLTGLPSGTIYYYGSEFDGESFMIPSTGAGVVLINRNQGSWNQFQTIAASGSYEAHLSEGRLALSLNPGDSTTAEFQFYERGSDGVQPWKSSGNPLLVNSYLRQFRQFLLHRNLLIVSKTDTPQSSTIYRHQADGTWRFEQVIPLRGTRSVSRGLILTDIGLYAETGPPDEPWVLTNNSITGSVENGIFFQSNSSSTGSRGFLLISEAGLPASIIDQDSYILTGIIGSNWQENAASVKLATISLNILSPRPTAPVDISIPYRTIPGGTATPDLDYLPVSGTIVLPAGSRTASLSIPILPDALIERPETVLVEFGPQSYGEIPGGGSPLTATIEDEGVSLAAPAAAISVPEPASGSVQYLIPFQMPRPSAEAFNAFVTIIAGTATAADATLVTSATVSVPAGSSIVPVPLTVLADSLAEGTEQLTVTVSLPRYSTPRRPQDGPFSITVNIDDAPGPGLTPDQYTTQQGQALEPDASRNVLSNDTVGTTSAAPGRAPLYGTVSWQADGTFRYTPPVNFTGPDRFAYLPAGGGLFRLPDPAPWKWLSPTNGQDPGTATAGFQTNWMQPFFNDTTWATGNRVMGYGVLGSGSGVAINTTLPLPASGNRFTAYFRTTFSVSGTPVPGVTLEFFCDDAAIFYLNGTELGRFDSTPGSAFYTAPDTYRLLASTVVDGDDETRLRRLYFPAAQLLSGSNTLAVSVHNNQAGSSDLGLRVTQLNAGAIISPVYVTVQVQDSQAVPLLAADTYSVPGTTTPLDSYLIGGSLYQNDGLSGWDGAPYDPILEVETGGSPAGPVTVNKDTGHFLMAAPPGFYGNTSFTYRVRDKDGWSLPASVTLTISPTRAYDVWRQAQFGGGSTGGIGLPQQDSDADSLPNLLEFTLNGNPSASSSNPPLRIRRVGTDWEFTFAARNTFGLDAFLTLEEINQDPQSPWTPLARLNDWYPELTRLAAGVSLTEDSIGGMRNYRILVPATDAPLGFFRLRASQERHPLDP